MDIDPETSWTDEILEYLKHDKLPDDKDEARRVKYHAKKYLTENENLYQ